MRHLGIDYGTKKVGLALSDEAGTMGFPHAVIPAAEAGGYVLDLIKAQGVARVVMGESRDYAGAANPVAGPARAFAEYIERHAGVPVVFEPEFLTTAEARRAPAKEGKTRAEKPRADVDASAAALILTSYLTKHRHG
ncbi:MAG TPA: Holliday junction resolvase RuvX [Candidatus Paceibacterota bacterium]|nr:Holliday junction resolvase RuvX [Candidatus Paceibacterota bacterium]